MDPLATLVFAYGSNLDRDAMRERCPAAVPLGRATLPDHRLVFRGFADVVPTPGSSVRGGLWRVTPACLEALDAYEEVADGLYTRAMLLVLPDDDAEVLAVVYRMGEAPFAPPTGEMLKAVLQGYDDFGLDPAPVHRAAREAASIAERADG